MDPNKSSECKTGKEVRYGWFLRALTEQRPTSSQQAFMGYRFKYSGSNYNDEIVRHKSVDSVP